MARGKGSAVGDTNVSANGYHYTKTIKGWRLTHHIIAEQKFGVKLNGEYTARFADGDRTNLSPDNIEIMEKGKSSLRKRRAILEAKRDDIDAELKVINDELGDYAKHAKEHPQ